MEVAELVDAAGGLGRRKKMTRWVSPTRLQAFHAPLGATVVRAPPQIGIVIVGEITCRRAGRNENKAVHVTEQYM
jgi:xanthine/CO dehydrogenase XdhC/CoxF family maturation factor